MLRREPSADVGANPEPVTAQTRLPTDVSREAATYRRGPVLRRRQRSSALPSGRRASAPVQSMSRSTKEATVQTLRLVLGCAAAVAGAMYPAAADASHPSRIAFSSNRSGDTEIYVMRADGTGARRLTHSP